MRVRLLGALLAATVLAALAAGPAGAAPEQVSRAEIRWRLGDRLDTRLTRSCIRPRARSRSGGGYTGGAYSHNGNATGTVDAAARTGGATLSSGTLRFAKTRRAARGFRSVSLGHLGVQLEGQGGYLTAQVGGRTVRVARMARSCPPAPSRPPPAWRSPRAPRGST
jgi:hypothetical protein